MGDVLDSCRPALRMMNVILKEEKPVKQVNAPRARAAGRKVIENSSESDDDATDEEEEKKNEKEKKKAVKPMMITERFTETFRAGDSFSCVFRPRNDRQAEWLKTVHLYAKDLVEQKWKTNGGTEKVKLMWLSEDYTRQKERDRLSVQQQQKLNVMLKQCEENGGQTIRVVDLLSDYKAITKIG
uniref:Uncharacterized protein n=1 Tax=Chromera velia CCMP2878 TaxID=1169474 RepID=A0A0G4HUA0_9ALVE|eukprot:Cvel_1366.t1-p1 / transcript=Cvel_1366.t1 / gene=Cvel_1366 / organism=Chromera_velia_CCMP2878 / gene_product=hypothetical protein / transcript_product=hypothetical protein / location=Cvel_scaffold47:48268-48816(+) / protein_length=183 / sequence_SO=supercontig / SO=protein_coding / is_pseudo=false